MPTSPTFDTITVRQGISPDNFPPLPDGTLLANIYGSAAPPSGCSISSLLDYVFGAAPGSLLMRGSSGWTTLAPGASGQVLQSQGNGFVWGAQASGTTVVSGSGSGGTVTSITAGTGLTGGTITNTGTIALSTPVAAVNGGTGHTSYTNGQLLIGSAASGLVAANLTAGSGVTITNGPGTITISASGAASGAAVTSLTAGTGLTGGTITNTGTIALSIPVSPSNGGTGQTTYQNGQLLIGSAVSGLVAANLTAGSGISIANGNGTITISSTVSGGGASGTVTNIQTGSGLTGGPISVSGTISLASIPTGDVLANISGSTAAPTAAPVASLLSSALGSTRGSLAEYGSGGWGQLAPGTSGYVLTTQGAGNDPVWMAQPYLISAFAPSGMSASQVLLVHAFGKAVSFPANFGTTLSAEVSKAGATVNATSQNIFNINKCLAANDPTSAGNWSQIGTVTFAASGHSGTFATSGGAAQSFAQGDYLQVVAPASADATLANVFITLAADR